MDQKTLWQQYQSLPDEVQQQVVDFLSFLHSKYGSMSKERMVALDLTEDPFVGMWQSRSDMSDSRMWVRNLRKGEWCDQQD